MKSSLLRNQLAKRIRAMRAIQRGVRAFWYLGRPQEMRVRATVPANASIRTIFHQLTLAWSSVAESTAVPMDQVLDKCGAVVLVPRTRPVPWEDYTEDVLDITEEVLASDEYYASYIEQLWSDYLAQQARTTEEKEALALYLKLKARFEPGVPQGASTR